MRGKRGGQYRSAIFVHSEEQKEIAEDLKQKFEKRYGQTIYTEIKPAESFHEAEEYHQNYYKKNGIKGASFANQM